LTENHRPNNYLEKFDQLKDQHQSYYHTIESEKIATEKERMLQDKNQKQREADIRLEKVLNTVRLIEKDEMIDGEVKAAHVRKYICGLLTPVISEGLLKIVETKPTNPVDYLVGSLDSRPSTCMTEVLNSSHTSLSVN
jgi:hypothetical protein